MGAQGVAGGFKVGQRFSQAKMVKKTVDTPGGLT